MTTADVLNRFEQAGPDDDNELIVDGTMTVEGTLDFEGNFATGNLFVLGDLTVPGTATFDTDTSKFVSTGGIDLATRVFTVEMPNITQSGSEVSVFPELSGKLIAVDLIMLGPTSASPTEVKFQKFSTPGGGADITSATINVTVPSVKDQVFSTSPTGAEADFTTSDALRVITDNAGTGTDSMAVIAFTFLLD